MSLILPQKYSEEREAYLHHQTTKFKSDLDTFIDSNQNIKDPYFILFRDKFDKNNPNLEKQVFSVYDHRPPFIIGSMVYWIDNSRGCSAHLWTVNHQKKVRFNIESAKKLKCILRSAA